MPVSFEEHCTNAVSFEYNRAPKAVAKAPNPSQKATNKLGNENVLDTK